MRIDANKEEIMDRTLNGWPTIAHHKNIYWFQFCFFSSISFFVCACVSLNSFRKEVEVDFYVCKSF